MPLFIVENNVTECVISWLSEIKQNHNKLVWFTFLMLENKIEATITQKSFLEACFLLFIPCHTIVAGYYGFTLDVRVSVRPSVVRPDDNLSKLQWIFTKLGMCIDIVEIWFGIANGQISSNFDGVICPRHTHIFASRR